MDKKKILIVSSSFYPMNSPRSFRTTELVKEFARMGHEVTLLTVKDKEHHIPFEEKYGITIKDFGPLRFPKIMLRDHGTIIGFIRRAMRRGMHLFFEYPDIELVYRVRKALKKESGYDLLISIAVPHPIHWGVASVWDSKSSLAQTWVADCGDPYMGATMDTFNKMFYFKYAEKYFCRRADYITVPLEEAKVGYYPEFRDKIRVIPQGFNFEVGIEHSSYTKHRVPTFAYAGSLIPGGRDPREFLDYLVSLNQEYKFILFSKSLDLVKPYLEPANGKIEIRDYIPRNDLLQFLSSMDFLVNFENRVSRQLPSKLIDYYLTGRPVLSVGSSEIDETAVDEFLRGNYSKQYDFKNMDRYRIENVSESFLELCKTEEYAYE